MSLQKLMSNYADYNLWANKTYVRWIQSKPAEILTKEIPSSFPSIIKTFTHLLQTEKFWLTILQGAKPSWSRAEVANDDIMPGLLKQSETMTSYIHSLSERDVLEVCDLDTPWIKGRLPKYEYIQHCFTHGAYHRGQIVTISRNLGITDPPMTDYNYYNMVVRDKIPIEA